MFPRVRSFTRFSPFYFRATFLVDLFLFSPFYQPFAKLERHSLGKRTQVSRDSPCEKPDYTPYKKKIFENLLSLFVDVESVNSSK